MNELDGHAAVRPVSAVVLDRQPVVTADESFHLHGAAVHRDAERVEFGRTAVAHEVPVAGEVIAERRDELGVLVVDFLRDLTDVLAVLVLVVEERRVGAGLEIDVGDGGVDLGARVVLDDHVLAVLVQEGEEDIGDVRLVRDQDHVARFERVDAVVDRDLDAADRRGRGARGGARVRLGIVVVVSDGLAARGEEKEQGHSNLPGGAGE